MKEMQDYGFNVILKEYSGFPGFLSLPCDWEHGWTALSLPAASDLATSKPLMLVFSQRRELAWKEICAKPVAVMGAPFVHFRRMRNITKSKDARGTVAFPSHSCIGVEAIFDVAVYCQQLRDLPEAFQPVTICLHADDINRRKGDEYGRHGFTVVSAGDQFAEDFPNKFYSILSSHSFATSNVVGSYSFYAVEMDIPFFIVGDIVIMDNYGNDPNVPRRYSLLDYPIGKMAHELFSTGPSDHIADRQKRFVREEMGVDACLSSVALRRLLWKHKAIQVIKHVVRAPRRIARATLRALKARVRYRLYLRRYGLDFDNLIFSHMTLEEKVRLHQTVRSSLGGNNLVCVEIGSYLGASTCFIANALTADSLLFCIDTWQNDAMKYSSVDTDAEPRDTNREFRGNTAKYSDRLVEIRKWSSDAIHDVSARVDHIDFLFVDGDHNYDGVKADWALYSPLLKAGSIVVFHDTGWADGVKRIIAESVISRSEKVFDLPNIQGFVIR